MSILREIARSAVRSGARTGAKRSLGGGMLGFGLGALAARVATRSVPGAILVGGGLLAKYLWDKKQEREAEETGGTVRESEDAARHSEPDADEDNG